MRLIWELGNDIVKMEVVRSLLNSAMLYEISRDMLLSRADESFDDRAKVVYKPE